MDLFEHAAGDDAGGRRPLAERMRPKSLDEIVGQQHLLGRGRLLRRMIEGDSLGSIVFWGPPGTGKTTIARAAAHATEATFVAFSAVLSGVPELRKVIAAAKSRQSMTLTQSRRTLLFVDEIHRFNKAQQDALLPHVEDGTVTLIGATTENPSFAVNAALLSRARVFRLEPLSEEDLTQLLMRALSDSVRGVGALRLTAEEAVISAIAQGCTGDARRALSVLEMLAADAGLAGHLSQDNVQQLLVTRSLLYDGSGEEHFNVSSALIKSLRGSDPDAALYWMMRMLVAGDDPAFVLRRLIIFASEDIGNADPRALTVATSADAAFHRLGMPEAMHAMAQCCLYLAAAPKSNAAYAAWKAAEAAVQDHGSLPVPLHLRNKAPRSDHSSAGPAVYRNPHDEGGFIRDIEYLPERIAAEHFYFPKQSGFEVRIASRLAELRRVNTPKD